MRSAIRANGTIAIVVLVGLAFPGGPSVSARVPAGGLVHVAAGIQDPFGAVTAVFKDGGGSTGRLPLELHRDRYLYLQGRLNDTQTDLVLDSGAGATVIDAQLAKAMGLRLEGGVRATGVGGTVPAQMTRDIRVQVGSLELTLAAAVVIDLDGVARQLGRRMPVILGRDVFSRLVVDIDYPSRSVVLHAPATFKREPGLEPHELRVDQGRYQIQGRLEDLPAAWFELDTGSADALVVFGPYAASSRLLDGRDPISTRQIGGVGWTTVARLATIRKMVLGANAVTDVPAVFHDGRTGAFATDRAAGLIGAGLLGRFRVVFDVSERTLLLSPGKEAYTPFPKDRLGLQVRREGATLRVEHVAARSPAERGGWRIGDRIVAAQGAAPPPDEWSWWRDIVTQAAGREVMLRDGRGADRRLVLLDYYLRFPTLRPAQGRPQVQSRRDGNHFPSGIHTYSRRGPRSRR
jgi:hypothetical protein